MPTLGIIGSGNIGAAVARLAVAAGIPVVVANSRGPESLAGLIAELGPLATAPPVLSTRRPRPATSSCCPCHSPRTPPSPRRR